MFCACDFLFVIDLPTQSSKRRKIVTETATCLMSCMFLWEENCTSSAVCVN